MSNTLQVATGGAPLAKAKAVTILLHGRGASAENMMELADVIAQPDIAYLAPQATGGSWYPYSFLAPLQENEPYLTRSLAMIEAVIGDVTRQGFEQERIAILGFSQGGCLGLEFAARNAMRYGAVIGLSAGLIGPDGTPRNYSGSLSGTPVFLGCSDDDTHIPLARVHESSRVLGALEGNVTERIYPSMGHTINNDEINHVRSMIAGLHRAIPTSRDG